MKNKEFRDAKLKEILAEGARANLNCVIFARISDEDRDGRDLSIDFQITKCRNLAKKLKMKVVKIFSEQKSGMNPKKRTVYNEMLDFVKDKKNSIDACIVFNLSRAGRNLEDSLKTLREFRERGQKVISTVEDYGDSANERVMLNINLTMNEHQAVSAADTVFGCLVEAAKLGRVTGEVPIGFIRKKIGDETYYDLDPVYAPVVKYIFESADNGLSYKSILEHLKEQGIKTPHKKDGNGKRGGKDFTKSYLYYILSNPIYKSYKSYARENKNRGYRVTHLETPPIFLHMPDKIPPIVSEELFDRVQALLANRRIGTRDYMGLDTEPLRGKMRCTCSGKRVMHKATKVNRYKLKTPYYQCPEHKRDIKACGIRDLNKNYADYAIYSLLDGIVNATAVREQVIAKIADKEAEIKRDVQKAKRSIETEKDKLGGIIEISLTTDYAREVRDRKIRDSEAELNRLTGVMSQHQERLDGLNAIFATGVPEQRTIAYSKQNQRRLVEKLIDGISVDNEKIRITIKIKETNGNE